MESQKSNYGIRAFKRDNAKDKNRIRKFTGRNQQTVSIKAGM